MILNPKELVTNIIPESTNTHYFKMFSKTWDFAHQTISLHLYQIIGSVERLIQTFDLLMSGANKRSFILKQTCS